MTTERQPALHVYLTEAGWVWQIEGAPTTYEAAMRIGEAILAVLQRDPVRMVQGITGVMELNILDVRDARTNGARQ